MVFDNRLGYDPDEWEECPEAEHFLVFSPLTRYLLTGAAILFIYYFFKTLDEHKNGGAKVAEEPTMEEVAATAAAAQTQFDQARQGINQQLKTTQQHQTQNIPKNADELLHEADEYLRESAQKTLPNGKNLVEEARNNFPSFELDVVGKPINATKEFFDNSVSAVGSFINKTINMESSSPTNARQFQQFPPQSSSETPLSDQAFAHDFEHVPAHLKNVAQQYYENQPQQQGAAAVVPISRSEKQLLQEFDVYDAQRDDAEQKINRSYEQPLQIQPTQLESNFDFAQLSPTSKLHYKQLQAQQRPGQILDLSQISTKGQAASVAATQKTTREKRLSEQDERALQDWEQEKALLEAERIKKLLDHEAGGDTNTDLTSSQKAFDHFSPASHISYESHSNDAPFQHNTPLAPRNQNNQHHLPLQTTANLRDSQLTDYDISDFHHDQFVDQHYQNQPNVASKPSQVERRRTTGDSDDYVKVSEPIYDYPPTSNHPQFGVPPHLPSQQQQQQSSKRISPTEAAQLQELCQEYDLGLDLPGVSPIAQRPPHSSTNQHRQPTVPQSVINVPISRRTDVVIQGQNEDPQKLATADLFVNDALEYLDHNDKKGINQPFVMEEEDILSNQEGLPKESSGFKKQQSFGGEATSRQVRTNDVFERVETDEHDDMTYAPEIQSVEIPPDQMSETSENIIDYFDKIAADSEQQTRALQQQLQPPSPHQQAGTIKRQQHGGIQAPQILPAFGKRIPSNSSLGSTGRSGSGTSDVYPYRHLRKQSSLLSVLGVTSMQEILLTIDSLDALSEAMRRAGLETTNLIFGIDYTASNKYQGEESFGGRSLHTIHPNIKNPYQQVISILGRTLAPFAGHGIGVYGFGDAKTGDWSVFNLKPDGECRNLDQVLSVYNSITPTVALSGPTNFAPLIYQAMETCQKSRDYHILVIIADGQVTNERATRRAIVQACQHPLSIIVVGVGDGPWDMMRVFDESLPKRPWDNFHFVELNDIMKKTRNVEDGDVKLAVHSLLEIPDQYRCICELGLLDRSIPPRGSEIRRELMHNPL